MRLVIILVLLCIFLISSTKGNVTFENVTVDIGSQIINITSSSSLKENLPSIFATTEVTIRGRIPVLHENSISDLDSLTYLELNNVQLSEINPGAIRNLPQLETLTIKRNKIREIKEDSFLGLNMSYLWLNLNSISVLHRGAFKHLQADFFSLNDNDISTISREVFQNVTVKTLSLRYNRLVQIESGAFSGILGLESLYLGYNKLQKINPEVFNLPNLSYLDLNSNSLKVLKRGDFHNLRNLKHLQLDGNELRELPSGLFSHSSKLTDLTISHNKIGFISPNCFDKLRNLDWLDLSHNQITAWDKAWFTSTPKLSYVRLSDNRIEELPDGAFQNLDKVEHIILTRNRISKVARNLEINEIKNLWLDYNELNCIEGDLNEVFQGIDCVHFKGNPLKGNCPNLAGISFCNARTGNMN